MKYYPHQYAEALYEALQGKGEAERASILKRFMMLLEKNRAVPLLDRVVVAYERLFLKKNNMRKVSVESASPLRPEVREELKRALGREVLLTEKVEPELAAGLAITIDDAVLIDASAKKIIHSLFS